MFFLILPHFLVVFSKMFSQGASMNVPVMNLSGIFFVGFGQSRLRQPPEGTPFEEVFWSKLVH